MTNLDSQFHDKRWNDMLVVQIPLSSIWQSVPIAMVHRTKDFFPRIKQDIKENGLHFPLLIVKSDYAELLRQKAKFKAKILPLPTEEDFNGYTVWGGSNRYAIAKQLGYDSVDCVVFDEFVKAHKCQKMHRKPYLGKYY